MCRLPKYQRVEQICGSGVFCQETRSTKKQWKITSRHKCKWNSHANKSDRHLYVLSDTWCPELFHLLQAESPLVRYSAAVCYDTAHTFCLILLHPQCQKGLGWVLVPHPIPTDLSTWFLGDWFSALCLVCYEAAHKYMMKVFSFKLTCLWN